MTKARTHRLPAFWMLLLVLFTAARADAQEPRVLNQIRNLGNSGGSGGGSDSLRRRNKNEDSITITFRYLDTARSYKLDSSVTDFYQRFPIPKHHQFLGNIGSPSRSILFHPQQGGGWDPGFHALDAYRFTVNGARFYTTTRPYTELGYVLGAGQQQVIDLTHTQNLKPTWNMHLRYRLINSPGVFNNQVTNHNNYLITSWYQSTNRRYNNFFVIAANKLNGAENGGILTDQNYLDDVRFTDRFSIPTRLAAGSQRTRGFLGSSSGLVTGNRQNDFHAVLRQQYDLGRKDSLVTDSTVVPLFFPRVRFEHTLHYAEYKYTFSDPRIDSAFYNDAYGIRFTPYTAPDTVFLRDRWRELTNDFSAYQFPDAKNLNQFIKVGATLQSLKGWLRDTLSWANISVHGEYRNRTRSQKWDILASGRLHLTGWSRGDFHAFASLQRLLGTKLGSLQVGFENTNRTPPAIYDTRSQFYLDAPKNFFKENSARFFANVYNPALRLALGAEYFLITNYLYVTGYRTLAQESAVFNLLRLSARKTFRVTRNVYWDAEVWVQQQAGNAAVHVPLVYTYQRIAYQGNLGFRNLSLAVGLEGRYATPYKADAYSPVIGQFSYQDSAQIRNRPDLHAFFHFRIRGFKAFVRAENLNTLRFRAPAGFREHNFAAPAYPYPGMLIRFGIFWGFVN
ncbi:putative porin [Flaviaesturariibacter amylovorans]|uniref:Porin n=1 Tax=Flaviaesturariibacter amylovorans TaxID=1084520 RepID=A0ABP8GLU5_9BACT